MENSISLYQLNKLVKDTIKLNFDFSSWIFAEIDEIKVNQSGHCYLELIEKDEKQNSIIAKAKGIIWSKSYRMIKAYFESETGTKLEVGIKVLINVGIEFHEVYGYSLIIKDIEPSFTIGENEKKRQDIIKRLKTDGVFEMNKSTFLESVPKNIAIISSENAAGLNDFITHLNNNSRNYRFHLKLFPAFMQGENTEISVVSALDKIYKNENAFDLVVIIRGGGSKSDLSWFDNYWIAYNICQFPIPVITGIGHEHDDTICDMVAYEKLKTPTAVADYLIERFLDFETAINNFESIFSNKIEELIENETNEIEKISQIFRLVCKNKFDTNKNNIISLTENLKKSTKILIEMSYQNLLIIPKNLNKETHHSFRINNIKISQVHNNLKNLLKYYIKNLNNKLAVSEEYIKYNNPKNILKRGYSITLKDGKIIKSKNHVLENDILETIFTDGSIKSRSIT